MLNFLSSRFPIVQHFFISDAAVDITMVAQFFQLLSQSFILMVSADIRRVNIEC